MIVAAVEAELGPLPGRALGVGPLRAAATMARLLAEERPEYVILIGSAGAYSRAHPIGAAFVCASLGTLDGAAALGLAYSPLAPGPLSADPALCARLRAPTARVLTVSAITTDLRLRDALASGWDLEHLEAYGAALACAAAQVPFAAVLGVSNEVGPAAHAQWTAHRGAAERAAQDVVSRMADGLRRGQTAPDRPSASR